MTQGKDRDVRLDFFRGLAMFIIFVAHLPGNTWSGYIPARFGPSDATEMFVFCSGFASALAFGGSFRKFGFFIGTVRILHRCWQVYWSHIALFMTVATISIVATWRTDGTDYVRAMALSPFFAEPERGIVHLLTLTYVPNYFDILPMYIVVLTMVPPVMALARVHPLLVALFCGGLYLAQSSLSLDLPAEWWSDRPWFFNPFGWQLIFFTGFAFGSGWLPEPARRPRLGLAALGFTLAMGVVYWNAGWQPIASLQSLRDLLAPLADKTDFGILRYLHFLSLAYLALWLVNPRRHLLHMMAVRPVILVGQQALPVFMWSMSFAWALGVALDATGHTPLTITAANLTGFASLIAVAHIAGFVKSQPWRHRESRTKLQRPPSPENSAAPASVPGRLVPGE